MLTGRTRYRIGFRKKLVLQVEYWGGVFRGRYVPTDYGRLWRDATIEDMQAIERGEVTIDKPQRFRRPPPPLSPNENPPPTYERPPEPPNPPKPYAGNAPPNPIPKPRPVL